MKVQICKRRVQNVGCNYLIFNIVCNVYIFYLNNEYMKTGNNRYHTNLLRKFLTTHTRLFINTLSHTKIHTESAKNRRSNKINVRGSPLLSSCLSLIYIKTYQ